MYNNKLVLARKKIVQENFIKRKIYKDKRFGKFPLEIKIIPFTPTRKETELFKNFCSVLELIYKWSYKLRTPMIIDPVINKHGFIQKYDDGSYHICYKEKEESLSINNKENMDIFSLSNTLSIQNLRILFGINLFQIYRKKYKLV